MLHSPVWKQPFVRLATHKNPNLNMAIVLFDPTEESFDFADRPFEKLQEHIWSADQRARDVRKSVPRSRFCEDRSKHPRGIPKGT